MKRVFTVLIGAAMMLLGTSARAQMSQGDYKWTAGGGFASFSLAGSQSDKVDLPSMPGFYFGANLDYAFSTIDNLTVEPGAYIQHFGKTFKFGQGTEEKSYHANYLSVPINLKYAFPMEDSNFGIAVFTGPRFNIGGIGNMFSTGKTYPGLKPIEAQWGIGLAATIQDAVVIRAGFDTGLTKCIKDNKDLGFDDVIAHRNTIYFGVSFAF